MKKLIGVALLLGLLAVTSCGQQKKTDVVPALPTLKVNAGSQNITVKRGGYKWTADGESVVADALSPTEIGAELPGEKIDPEALLTLNFSKRPQSVIVKNWDAPDDTAFDFQNMTLKPPTKSGSYIYEITGAWAQGEVSYTLKIIVDPTAK